MSNLPTTFGELQILSSSFSYKKDGDLHERENGHLIIDTFPNAETFWQKFVTPTTKRIDSSTTNPKESIRFRNNISQNLLDLCVIQYSVFQNLVYAKYCLINKHLSYFENFYTHLGSICDLAEEFITQLYFITLECEGKETEVLQRLSKAKFLDLARGWYDKHYSTSFLYYLSKGKTAPFKIIGRSNILDEYFGKAIEWKQYSRLALQIRTYRNVVVHNTTIGSQITPNGIYVPKKQKIGDYKKWHQVFNISQDKFEKDFIDRDQEINEDLTSLKIALNELWYIPIQHFHRLLYNDQNKLLLAKYDLPLK